jgi:hypothetical protein
MAYGKYIMIKGPDRQGEFVATMPDGETRLVLFWEDLDALRQESGVEEVYGDVPNLHHRVRSLETQPQGTQSRVEMQPQGQPPEVQPQGAQPEFMTAS